MALQTSGPISLLNVQNEFGGSNPIGMNEYYGAASGVPTSGTIGLNAFYGKSSVVQYYSIYATGYSFEPKFSDGTITFADNTFVRRAINFPAGTARFSLSGFFGNATLDINFLLNGAQSTNWSHTNWTKIEAQRYGVTVATWYRNSLTPAIGAEYAAFRATSSYTLNKSSEPLGAWRCLITI